MRLKFIFLFLLNCAFITLNAQEKKQGPAYIGTADSLIYVPSLASKMDKLTPSRVKPPKEAQDGRLYRNNTYLIPGKGRQADVLSKNPHQLSQKVPGRTPDLVWTAALSNSQPTDPTMAIGPNHVFVVFNTGFAIYDKNGNNLVPQTSPNPDIFPFGGCCDLTVSYDPVATSAANPTPGRWVLSFLNGAGAGAQIAVSDGPDPVNAGWNVYTVNSINDYQKLSVWSDGYYMTDQNNGVRVYALERQAMLDGEPAANVSIQGFSLPDFNNFGFASLQALNISDDQYPGPGNATLVFYQDDAYPNQTDDSIKFWDLDVDFSTPLNSTISTPQEIIVTPFTSIFDGAAFNNLSQPNGGTDIDALQGIIMNQAQYKKFPTYESAIFNFVIDVDPSAGEQAAIRWYEFRRNTPTSPWVMAQEGTFADPNGRHFWHGSMVMDTQGNIGMGFSAMGNTATGNGLANEFVSSYYTGRLASDPSGTMTIAPQLIASGTANIPGIRYGDYSKIDIDPSDYTQMYFINEIMSPNRSNVVGRFQIAPVVTTDAGIVDIVNPVSGDLSALQDITVTVRNFGINSISNVPVSYTINGGTPINEVVAGPIAGSGGTINYTFTTQADLSTVGQTYTIEATIALNGDQDISNNSFSKNVENTICMPIGDCISFNDGVTQIQLADQNILNNCSANGYTDDTAIVFSFLLSNNPFQGTLQMGWPDSEFALWIDFNDNAIFESNELIANDFVANGNTDFNFSIDFDDFSNVTFGEHLMRLRGEDESGNGEVIVPCDELQYGRTNDFTAKFIYLDAGVTSLQNPISGSSLSTSEDVTIEISNFGNTTLTSIPLFYSINGGVPIQETYTGALPPNATATFTFSTPADLSPLGSYDFVAGTQLTGDLNNSNNDWAKTIFNINCIPSSDCQDFGDGVTQIQLANQDIATNCTASGYSNDTDVVFEFYLASNPFSATLQVGYQGSVFAIWIDFNDDGIFDADELIANNLVANAGTDFNFTINFDDFPSASEGTHLMRIRGGDENFSGVVTNSCDDLTYGRTNDYTAVITFPEQFSNTSILSSLQNSTFIPYKVDAYLNIIANNWGVVITRVNNVNTIANAVEGMLVFDARDNTFKVCTKGGLSPIWRALGN